MQRQIIIGAIAILVLLAGGGAGYFGGAMLAPPSPKPKEAATADAAAVDAEPSNKSAFYDLPEMLVTIKDPDNGARVLQLEVSIQCPSEGDRDMLKEYLPRVLDVFQTYVAGLTVKDLRGTRNLEALRVQLRDRVDAAIAPGQVSTILFHKLTVQ